MLDGGCRSGSCGTCEIRLISGRDRYAAKPDFDIIPVHCLLSVAAPASLLILVHVGIHFKAVLAGLAIGAMLLRVASGLTWKFLLRRAGAQLVATTQRRRGEGLTPRVMKDRLHWDCLTYDTVKQWQVLHCPITLAFAILGTAHIVSSVIFWGCHETLVSGNHRRQSRGHRCPCLCLSRSDAGPDGLIPAHASLATDCFARHAPLQGAVQARCATCHALADIGLRTVAGAPVAHSTPTSPFHQGLADSDCMGCLTDHPLASLTPPHSHTFVHAMLTPAAAVACFGCHMAPRIRPTRASPRNAGPTTHRPTGPQGPSTLTGFLR